VLEQVTKLPCCPQIEFTAVDSTTFQLPFNSPPPAAAPQPRVYRLRMELALEQTAGRERETQMLVRAEVTG
jgi:hypothetical protein